MGLGYSGRSDGATGLSQLPYINTLRVGSSSSVMRDGGPLFRVQGPALRGWGHVLVFLKLHTFINTIVYQGCVGIGCLQGFVLVRRAQNPSFLYYTAKDSIFVKFPIIF